MSEDSFSFVSFLNIFCLQGASIIGMLESFIGQDMLKAGLRLYLEAHRYGNAATDDLWEALTRILKKSGHNLDIKVGFCSYSPFIMYL